MWLIAIILDSADLQYELCTLYPTSYVTLGKPEFSAPVKWE